MDMVKSILLVRHIDVLGLGIDGQLRSLGLTVILFSLAIDTGPSHYGRS